MLTHFLMSVFLGVLSTKENVNLQTLGFEHVHSAIRELSIRSILQEKDLDGIYVPQGSSIRY